MSSRSKPGTKFVGDHYEILGVSKDASTEEIKKAFRKLARECHPDVAGDDPDAAARFTQVRRSYEVLADPNERARYDRAMERKRRVRSGGWRMPGGFRPGTTHSSRGGPRRRNTQQDPANKLDLEDIFGDFGGGMDFGFGTSSQASSTGPSARARAEARGEARQEPSSPQPGRDINLQVDVPFRVARDGGTVTLTFPRLRRAEDGRTLHRYDELYDLRVAPGTEHGDTIRIPRMGDAGAGGGPFGDLICDVVVLPAQPGDEEPRESHWERRQREEAERKAREQESRARRERQREARRPAPGAGSSGSGDTPGGAAGDAARGSPRDAGRDAAKDAGKEIVVVPITVAEALLGGRVGVQTPQGAVRLTVPPCSSSGTRLRLRGRASSGGDLYVELRIVTPSTLDEESRMLIEEFARLNPENPRD